MAQEWAGTGLCLEWEGAPGSSWGLPVTRAWVPEQLARPGRIGWSAPAPAGGGEGSPGCPPRARQRGLLQPCRIPGTSTGVCLLFKGSITVRSGSASAFKPTPSSGPSVAGEGLVPGIAHHLEEGVGVSVCGS